MFKEFKILAVDDQKSNLDVLIHILKEEYAVYPAKSGEAALKKAADVCPDLILLDIILPDMNGFEVLEKLKSDELTAQIPVIIITGLSNVEDEQRGLKLGAADYVTKPFNHEMIKTRVRNQIQIVKHKRTIEKYGMIDEDLNILNRKSFDRMLNIEWERAVRENNPVSLIMIEVDEFQPSIADGKPDAVIRKIIPVIEDKLKRATDIFARYEPATLVLILPNTPIKGIIEVAEDIGRSIRESHDEEGSELLFNIGASSLLPDKGEPVSLLVFQAERNLFKAKVTGEVVCL
ncbi:MAG: response regulator [Oscillospiraceae bacterium]|nr:response regulator [Oscillospiraceae bacterium]